MELWGDCWKSHLFSASFMMPFFGVSSALLSLNWYPAQIFVGDTYCYFAGMTFACVGILGHFSKTMLLFFIPQVLNFLFSCPQLFHFIECPRHRLPRYNKDEDILYPSTFEYVPSETGFIGRIFVWLYVKFGVIELVPIPESSDKKDDDQSKKGPRFRGTNCTLVNLMLLIFKPMKENNLTTVILVFQLLCSLVAFLIRYGLSRFIY
jgi:UDP-N-acetylglucosamine--dolichyl-phosphate N-acetylglucosaminephosphotransferase